MLPALLIMAGVFALLFFARTGGAYRAELKRRWPALLFAGAAILALARGAIWPALALSSLGALAWILWPQIAGTQSAQNRSSPADDAADAEARSILGVGQAATESDIRSAYRAKMAQAHPDRGGKHAEAARLTAARDRLLRKKP